MNRCEQAAVHARSINPLGVIMILFIAEAIDRVQISTGAGLDDIGGESLTADGGIAAIEFDLQETSPWASRPWLTARRR